MLKSSLAVVACLVALQSHVQAQGLVWKLPEQDGAWVRYEGTVEQTEARPDSNEGPKKMTWIKQLTIKSVGKEDADYQGNTVPCRWIEMKVQTGKPSAAGVDTGSVGERIYKILVPEAEVIGQTEDSEGLPVSYIPIVKGYRKTNDRDPAPKEIKSGILQIYPVISIIRHYRKMATAASPASVDVGLQSVSASVMTGSLELETKRHRILHETTELLRSDEVPFGLAGWTVKVTQERKGEVDPRAQFEFASEISVKMTARETGSDATSELVIEP